MLSQIPEALPDSDPESTPSLRDVERHQCHVIRYLLTGKYDSKKGGRGDSKLAAGKGGARCQSSLWA